MKDIYTFMEESSKQSEPTVDNIESVCVFDDTKNYKFSECYTFMDGLSQNIKEINCNSAVKNTQSSVSPKPSNERIQGEVYRERDNQNVYLHSFVAPGPGPESLPSYCPKNRCSECLCININNREIVETFNESNYSILLSFDIVILLFFITVQLIVIFILFYK